MKSPSTTFELPLNDFRICFGRFVGNFWATSLRLLCPRRNEMNPCITTPHTDTNGRPPYGAWPFVLCPTIDATAHQPDKRKSTKKRILSKNKKTPAAYAVVSNKKKKITETDCYPRAHFIPKPKTCGVRTGLKQKGKRICVSTTHYNNKKKKRLRRTHWPQTNTRISALKTHFVQKQIACGVRTGAKQK